MSTVICCSWIVWLSCNYWFSNTLAIKVIIDTDCKIIPVHFCPIPEAARHTLAFNFQCCHNFPEHVEQLVSSKAVGSKLCHRQTVLSMLSVSQKTECMASYLFIDNLTGNSRLRIDVVKCSVEVSQFNRPYEFIIGLVI